MSRRLTTLLAVVLFCGTLRAAHAQYIPYASYSITNPFSVFTFTNDGLTPGSGTFATKGFPVLFSWIPGTTIANAVVAGGGTLGPQAASLTVTSVTNGNATVSPPPPDSPLDISQPLGITSMIFRDAANNILLQVDSISSILSGDYGDFVGDFKASDVNGDGLILSSFFVPGLEALAPDSSFAFGTSNFLTSGGGTGFSLGSNDVLASGAGAFNGNLSAKGITAVPEGSSILMMLSGGSALGLLALRRRRA